MTASTLIQRGLVFDGSGSEGRLADARVEGGRVAELSEAPLAPLPGEHVIDAAGC